MPRAVDGQLQAAVNALQARVSADPEIQALLQQHKTQLAATRDKGGSAHTFQNRIRDQITAIAKRKGLLPTGGQYFLNPNDGQLEPHGGWSGLSNKTRVAIIAAAAGGGLGAAAMGGAFAGTAALGSTTAAGGVSTGAGVGGVATGGLFAPTAGLVGTTAATGGGFGAGGALTAAGGTLTAGKAASRWLGPVLDYGVPIAGGLIGQKLQANADKDAAAIQADYLNRALEVEKEKEQYGRGQRADYLARLQPYGAAGSAATGRAEALLTSSRYRPEIGSMANTQPAGGAMVRLKAPDGSVSEVSAAMADHYLNRGATRI